MLHSRIRYSTFETKFCQHSDVDRSLYPTKGTDIITRIHKTNLQTIILEFRSIISRLSTISERPPVIIYPNGADDGYQQINIGHLLIIIGKWQQVAKPFPITPRHWQIIIQNHPGSLRGARKLLETIRWISERPWQNAASSR